jgi:GNAT superfamily N-acetyltransferase
MAITFRQCAAADADLVSGLILDWHHLEGQAIDPALASRALRRLLEDSRLGHLWVIELGGMAIGYAALTFSDPAAGAPPRADIAALYLEPVHRGRGLGRRAQRFLQEVGAWLRVPGHSFDTDREQKHAALLHRPPTPHIAPEQGLERRAVA